MGGFRTWLAETLGIGADSHWLLRLVLRLLRRAEREGDEVLPLTVSESQADFEERISQAQERLDRHFRAPLATTEPSASSLLDKRAEKISVWRQMIVEVLDKVRRGADPLACLEMDPRFLELETYLTATEKRSIYHVHRIGASTIPSPLWFTKEAVARLESEWLGDRREQP